MRDVTADEVKSACLAAGITRVDHHDCGGCGAWVYYSVVDGNLFFNPACDCSRHWSPPEQCDWSEASDWINMQNEEWRPKTAAKFGISEGG